jgi:hypothetical protein
VLEATAAIVSDPQLRTIVPRAFDHSEMKHGCRPFASGNLPDHLKAITAAVVPDDLKLVANAFSELQQARHDADYNLAGVFTRPTTTEFVEQTRKAF